MTGFGIKSDGGGHTIIYLYYCAQITRGSRRRGGRTGTRSLGQGQHSTFDVPARFGTQRQTSRDSAVQKRDKDKEERERRKTDRLRQSESHARSSLSFFLPACLCRHSPNNNNYASRMYAHLGRLCPHSSDNKLGVHKDIKTQEIS